MKSEMMMMMMPEGEGEQEAESEDAQPPPGHHLDSQYCSSDEEFAAGNCRGCEKLCMSGTRYEEDMGMNMACTADCCTANDCSSGDMNMDDGMNMDDDNNMDGDMSGDGYGKPEGGKWNKFS